MSELERVLARALTDRDFLDKLKAGSVDVNKEFTLTASEKKALEALSQVGDGWDTFARAAADAVAQLFPPGGANVTSLGGGSRIEPKLERVVSKLARVAPKLERVEPKLERVAPKLERVNPKLERVAPKLERVSPKLERVAPKLERVEGKLERIEGKLEQNRDARA